MGPEENQEVSLRDTIEAAVEKVENPDPPTGQVTPVEPPPPPAPPQEGEEVKPPIEAAPPPKKDPVEPVPTQLEQAPKAWKPAAQKAWATLPPDVRAEVSRREKEVAKVFGETNFIREGVKQFSEIVRPFEARLQSVGYTPLQAVHELFKADHILTTAPPVQRAHYMAQLIKEYGVDIRELDNALAGQAPADPVKSQLETMLAERLSPLQAFLTNQQQIARQQEQRIQQDATTVIDQMEADTTKYPHFQNVKEDMADIIEMNAKRAIYLTPEQAYARAVAMNPEWGAQAVMQQQNAQQRQNALQQNNKAQRALNASASINGAPGNAPVTGLNQDASLRETIEAAFNQIEGGR